MKKIGKNTVQVAVKKHRIATRPTTEKLPVPGKTSKLCFTERFNEFLRSVQKAYSESCINSSILIKSNGKIIRGRACCIAGRVEDLFAMALYDVLKDRVPCLYIFVDLPLCFAANNGTNTRGSKICYPDIVVAQQENGVMKILYLIEVKLNIGWSRSKLTGEVRRADKREQIKTIEKELAAVLNKLSVSTVWSRISLHKNEYDGRNKPAKLEFTVSCDVKYDIILCSSTNVPNDALGKARKRIGDDAEAICRLFVLSDKELSPKYASKEKCEEQDLCAEDVGKFEQRIETIFSSKKRLGDDKCKIKFGHESTKAQDFALLAPEVNTIQSV